VIARAPGGARDNETLDHLSNGPHYLLLAARAVAGDIDGQLARQA
jgi:hypothetical protein